ncbi:hypothetical protein FHG87_022908 [Trinorchestia longiramus]|nr:hypothetical protein FHG87_022908 [Trinorchestia longiramus]
MPSTSGYPHRGDSACLPWARTRSHPSRVGVACSSDGCSALERWIEHLNLTRCVPMSSRRPSTRGTARWLVLLVMMIMRIMMMIMMMMMMMMTIMMMMIIIIIMMRMMISIIMMIRVMMMLMFPHKQEA